MSTNPFAALLGERARHDGDRPYIIPVDGQPWTFADMHAGTYQWARRLHSWGVDEHERVLLVVDNRPEFVMLWYACQLVGAIAVPFNPELTEDSNDYLLGLVRPALCVHALSDGPYRVRAAAARAGVPVVDLPDDRHAEPAASPPVVRSPDGFEPGAIGPEHPSQIICTSGTTGRPKGAIQTAGLLNGMSALAERIGITRDDRLLTASPLFHGLGQSWFQYSLVIGSAVVLAPRLSVSRFWAGCIHHSVNAMQHVGASLSFLLQQPPSRLDREHEVRFSFGIGAPEPVWRAFTERFGVDIIEFYGMTEIGLAAFNDRPGRVGSVGRLSGGVEMRLVDDTGAPVPTGTPGEAWTRPVCPDAKHPDYYAEPEATAAAIADGWFHTGDLLSIDDDGYLFFHGRKRESLRRRGENIVPEDLERCVVALDEIGDCAAIAVPSDLGDDDIELCVVLAAAAPDGDKSLDHLAKTIVDTVPRAMRPRYLSLHEALPYTLTNKLQRAKLRGDDRQCWDIETSTWVSPKRTR